MQNLKTKLELLLFRFGALLILIAPSESLRIDNRVIGYETESRNKIDIDVHIKEIPSSANDINELISYQSIDQASTVIGDERKKENPKILEISLNGFHDADVTFFHLITTLANDSCEENILLTLPSWKIDKRVSGETFRVKINRAETFAGQTLFLCVSDENSGEFQHLGANSAIHFDQ